MDNIPGLASESNKSLQVFYLLHANLIIVEFIFSIHFYQKTQIGKQFFHKREFLIFFGQVLR